MPLQKEGVVLAVEGANQFIDSMGRARDAHGRFIAGLQKGETAASGMGGGLGKLGSAAGAAKGAIGGLSVGVIAAGAAVAGAAVGVVKLTQGLISLAKQTAPLEGLQNQFATLTASIEGGSAGMLSALRAGAQGMVSNRDLMQQYNLAASLVNKQFAETLPESMGLVSKAAAATGQNMGFLMDSLVRGVGRVSPLILDNLGIQVAVSEATARASEMYGKQTDALSKTEQQTALATIALEKLREKYGEMPSTAGSAAQQMAAFQANIQNIKDTLGQFLLPAFSSFLQGINALVSAFSSAISEGGAFYPILVNLGAALALLADGFQWLANRAGDWLDELNISWTENVGGMAQSAIQWGAEIVTNFAVGMIDAANTVLTWAMQQIQNILMWWLAPGSPPKVAPDLDKWGIAAFESYLHGMTDADFGILERIQGPLKKMLSGPAFADVSKAFSAAMAGGDRAGALSVLTESSKQFGDDIAELAKREFALADATTAVEQAELALAAARDRASSANRKVAEQTREYNRLLREGADKATLDAQLARINASEKEARAAQEDVSASEAGLDAAKSRVDVLKEQVEWQRRFLEQLFGISDALTEQEKREKAATEATKGKGKGAALPEAVAPTGPAGGIGGAIAGAIEAAKGRIKESLGGIWETIQSEFSEKWDAAIAKLGQTWQQFVTIVGKAWDELKAKYPFLQDVETWIVSLPGKIATLISEGWDALTNALSGIWSFISTYVLPIFKDLATLGILFVQYKLIDLGQKFAVWLGQVQTVWSWLKDIFVPFVRGPVGGVFEWLAGIITTKLTWAINDAKEALKQLHIWLGNAIERMKEIIGIKKKTGIFGESPSPLAVGISTAADAMERLARISMPQFESALAFRPAGIGGSYRPAGATSYTTSNSFSFSTTVGDRMDAAALEGLILRTVRRALATGV